MGHDHAPTPNTKETIKEHVGQLHQILLNSVTLRLVVTRYTRYAKQCER